MKEAAIGPLSPPGRHRAAFSTGLDQSHAAG